MNGTVNDASTTTTIPRATAPDSAQDPKVIGKTLIKLRTIDCIH